MTLAQPQSATQAIEVFSVMEHFTASSLYLLLHKAHMSVLYEVWTQLRLQASSWTRGNPFSVLKQNFHNVFISILTLVLKKKRRLLAVQ